jgi:hypothetical protein
MDRIHQTVGTWFVRKWRDRARETSVFHAALQMKKQGVPVEVAIATLGVRL